MGSRRARWSSSKPLWRRRRAGKIAVMTFHGVPDIKHPWVNTDPAKFEAYMQHLKDEGCTVIAMRDLVKYLK
jgi:hypothetical protein